MKMIRECFSEHFYELISLDKWILFNVPLIGFSAAAIEKSFWRFSIAHEREKWREKKLKMKCKKSYERSYVASEAVVSVSISDDGLAWRTPTFHWCMGMRLMRSG